MTLWAKCFRMSMRLARDSTLPSADDAALFDARGVVLVYPVGLEPETVQKSPEVQDLTSSR